MRLHRSAALAALLLATVALSGCALLGKLSFKQPELSYLRTEIRGLSLDKATVDFVINAKNPNKFGLGNLALGYKLSHGDRTLVSADSIRVDLAASGDTEIRIPASVVYLDVFHSAAALTSRILAGDSTVAVRLDADLSGKPSVETSGAGTLQSPVAFSRALSHTADIPIPRKQADEGLQNLKDRALEGLRGLF